MVVGILLAEELKGAQMARKVHITALVTEKEYGYMGGAKFCVVVDYPIVIANEHAQKRGPLAKKRKFGDLCIHYKSELMSLL
ncbi:hypothetical protein Prudu_003760, partial [Prunus dulcis]